MQPLEELLVSQAGHYLLCFVPCAACALIKIHHVTRSQRAEQLLEETAHHVVKALNSPVPVQVQEALRSDLSGEICFLWSSVRATLNIYAL